MFIPAQKFVFVFCMCRHVFNNPVTLYTVQNQLTHLTTVNSDWCDKLGSAKQHNGPQLRVQRELLPGVELNELYWAAPHQDTSVNC